MFLVQDELANTLKTHLCFGFRAFGRASRLLSDNHSVFLSKEMHDFYAAFEIRHCTSKIYRARFNGVVERMHRSVCEALRACNADSLHPMALEYTLTKIVFRFSSSILEFRSCNFRSKLSVPRTL